MRQVAHRAAHEGSTRRSRHSILALTGLLRCCPSVTMDQRGAFECSAVRLGG